MSIGRETLETVCRQLRDWSNALPGNALALTVNLTHRQFFQEDMASQPIDATGALEIAVEVHRTSLPGA